MMILEAKRVKSAAVRLEGRGRRRVETYISMQSAAVRL
jgi:hypothetical protein